MKDPLVGIAKFRSELLFCPEPSPPAAFPILLVGNSVLPLLLNQNIGIILDSCFFFSSYPLYPICQGVFLPVLTKYIQYFVTSYFSTLAILICVTTISWLDYRKGILNRSRIFYSCPQQSILKTTITVIDAFNT